MPPQQPQESPEELIRTLARQIAADITSIEALNRFQSVGLTILTEFLTIVVGVGFRLTTPFTTATLRGMFQAAEATEADRADITALALENIFGVKVDAARLRSLSARGSTTVVSREAVAAMIGTLTGGSTTIDPSEEPARRYVQVVLNNALESWTLGATMELLSCATPGIEQLQTLGEAGSRVATALGIGDSSSRVLRPYIDNLVVEPLRRHIDRTYRPALLSPAMAAQQIHRGRGNAESWRDEMRLQGWSEERIDAFIASQQKFLSAEQLSWLEREQIISREEAVQTLREQGYDEQNASKQLIIRQFEWEAAIRRRIVTDAMSAFENRLIEEAELSRTLAATIFSARERTLLLEAARARRLLNIARIGKGDVEQAVRVGILPMSAYRRWLERVGFNEDDSTTLELLLRYEIDKQKEIADHRAELEAERAAERQAREEERARRKAEIEAERALQRRGAESDLERAAVRGLIPFSRLEDVLAEKYDGDTVAILLSVVEDDRQRYLEQQQRAEDARQRAARRNLDVGAVEQAVLAGVLTLDEFARHAALATLDPADRQILIATLTARKAALEAAHAQRREAEIAASRRAIDLGRFERLVRRGARTLADYDRLLASLGFTDAARAAMRELLALEIADDQTARQTREDAAARLRARGLSLEQLRRAVLLGVKSLDDFQEFLAQQGFTTDAQAVLIAELRADVAEADAARRRRAQPAPPPEARVLPLATVRHAAQLGVISPDVYQVRLVRDGYSADDVDLELELLLLEIADVQASRATRETSGAAATARGLALAQVERAVKAGVSSLEDYRARAFGLGFSGDDTDSLVVVLASELETTAAAKARKAELAGELEAATIPLALLEDQVHAGTLSIDGLLATLVARGIAPDDAELLAALLVDALEARAAA